MKIVIFIFLFFQSVSVISQVNKDSVLVCEIPKVPSLAKFPGGQDKLIKFINENFKVPSPDWCGQGTIYVKFKVDSIGNISEGTIYKGVDSLSNNEALRIVEIMPKWIPAILEGKSISTWYCLPIRLN